MLVGMTQTVLLDQIRERRSSIQRQIDELTADLLALDDAARALGDESVPPRPQRRVPMSDARLEEVARIYLAAERTPTKTVAEGLKLTYSRAAHLVMDARKAGKIPPARR